MASDQPIYRAEIRETDQGWFWRVEVDVRNGRAWSGEAESYSEAARQAVRKLLALSAIVESPLREASPERSETPGQRITHGRHCTCSSCAQEDWTNADLAPCGMHGADCPALYQPWGPAGSYLDPAHEAPNPDAPAEPSGRPSRGQSE